MLKRYSATQLVVKYGHQLQYVFLALPYLLILTFICLLIESVAYPGFVAKYLLIDSQFLFYLSFALILLQAYLVMYVPKYYLSEFLLFLFKLNRIGVVALVLINYILITLEKEHFSNYVFSNFHIHLSVLNQIVTFSVGLAVIEFVLQHNELVEFIKRRFNSLIQIIFLVTILSVAAPQLQDTGTMVFLGSIDIVKDPIRSYDSKIVALMNGNQEAGWVYTYGQFLNKHVPEESVIFIPPQIEPWLMEGNQYYMRWFVYPRKLYYSRDVEAAIPSEVTHIMIAHGSWPWGAQSFGWPRISIPKENIEQIVLINRDTLEEQTFVGVGYAWQEDEPRWGVITLKK